MSPYKGPNTGTFLEPFGKYDLLEYMNKYWVSQGSPNYDFWGHEFSKHAKCYSTFDVPCYGPEYRQHEGVVDFFETAILTIRGSLHGIVQASARLIMLRIRSRIYGLLSPTNGAVPYIGCSGPSYNSTAAGNGTLDMGYTVLNEVWYYSRVHGKPQYGHSVPVNASGSNTNGTTSAGEIHYYERTPGSEK